MRHEVVFSPEAVADFKVLKANVRAVVRDTIEKHLRFEPTKESKRRIKKLRGIRHPQYRLRVDEIRVFYDIHGNKVEVLAIVEKSQAAAWLKNIGEAK
ncbi:MAG: type II toxin-antitoxin system RelE/ParE family toxin [Deltaproteobacteria bacterium]|nr:type II toxin-antitoxin system RelE/ParE family toxin [Deltaproteobacteria bacterium]